MTEEEGAAFSSEIHRTSRGPSWPKDVIPNSARLILRGWVASSARVGSVRFRATSLRLCGSAAAAVECDVMFGGDDD